MARVAVLASGRGSNLQSLIDARDRGDLPCELVLVVSNRAGSGAIERAERAGIPTAVVDHRGRSREEFDAEVVALLREAGAEWVVLAGFMRLLSAVFLEAFRGRVINIHPALLPSFPGCHGHRDALAYGVKVSGCTVHLVDDGMDSGPVIAQVAVPVLPDDTEETLSQRVLRWEHYILPRAVRWAVEGRLSVRGRHVTLIDPAIGEEQFVLVTDPEGRPPT